MKYQIQGSPQLPSHADRLWFWLGNSHRWESIRFYSSKIDPSIWICSLLFDHLPIAPLLQEGGGGGGHAHA